MNKPTSDSKKDSVLQGIERRRTRRRPILETFSVFCVVPKKGMHRLQIHDVSDHGIGFDLDLEGELAQDFAVKNGESLDIHFYLNQSLYLPLTIRVARIEDRNATDAQSDAKVRRIGAEFDLKDKGHHAFLSFLQMLDAIVDVAQIQTG
jgi:hypothetical protein